LLILNWVSWLMHVVNIWVLVQSRRLLRIRSVLNFGLVAKLIGRLKWITLVSSILIVLIKIFEGLVRWEGLATCLKITRLLGFSLRLRIKWGILRKTSYLLNWTSINILMLEWISLILVNTLSILALVIMWLYWTSYFLFCDLISRLLMSKVWWWCFLCRNYVLTSYDQLSFSVSKWNWLLLVVKNFFFC